MPLLRGTSFDFKALHKPGIVVLTVQFLNRTTVILICEIQDAYLCIRCFAHLGIREINRATILNSSLEKVNSEKIILLHEPSH